MTNGMERAVEVEQPGLFDVAYDAALERAAQMATKYGAPPQATAAIRGLKLQEQTGQSQEGPSEDEIALALEPFSEGESDCPCGRGAEPCPGPDGKPLCATPQAGCAKEGQTIPLQEFQAVQAACERFRAALEDVANPLNALRPVHQIQSIARRALSASPPPWQPIETAPKDRSWILVWDSNDIDDDKWSRCAVVQWRERGRNRSAGPGWFDDRIFPVHGATHWRPLPAPPLLAEQGGRS